MKTGNTAIPILAILMLLLACMNLQATTYEVGLTKPLTAIGEVSWESLQGGDTVLIYWRTSPYKEKWVICRQGTQAAVGLYNLTVRAAESQATPANDTQDLSVGHAEDRGDWTSGLQLCPGSLKILEMPLGFC